MEQAKDVSNLINTGERAVDYFSVIGQIPWLDNLFDKNPICHIGPPSFGASAAFGLEQILARKIQDQPDGNRQQDFLDDFLPERHHGK